MKSIVNKFINDLNEAEIEAYGMYFVHKQGMINHNQLEKNDPFGIVKLCADNPNTPTKWIKKITTISKIHSKLAQNEGLIFEIYLSKIVQLWSDFLENLYLYAVNKNLYNNGKYQIQAEDLRINLSVTLGEINKDILSLAVNKFSFLPEKDKILRIKKIYNVKSDFNLNDKDIRIIVTNIHIRNIIQHNMGIIKKSDLDSLGVNEIWEDDGKSKISKKAGDKITRTFFDIENLTEAMINAANKIIQQ